MSWVQLFKLHQEIWPRGRLLCQNWCQPGNLYFRQCNPFILPKAISEIYFFFLQFFVCNFKSLFILNGAWYFRFSESNAIQKLSHKFHLNLFFFSNIKTFYFLRWWMAWLWSYKDEILSLSLDIENKSSNLLFLSSKIFRMANACRFSFLSSNCFNFLGHFIHSYNFQN